MSHLHRRLVLVLLGVVAALAATAGPASANPRVWGPEQRPYGQSYSEWAAEWWTWALGQPNMRVISDPTGEFCADGQQGHVWFLAGSFGQQVTRRCTVPPGRALLFPLVNSPWIGFNDPPENQTEEFIREQARRAETATDLKASIDGVDIPGLHRYFERSIIFEAVVPAENLFDLPGGFLTGPNVDSGYYLVVKPLPPGHHVIRFSGKMPPSFSLDVTYHLTVGR